MSKKSEKKNKIYYGEYSLKHWIDLILKKNIELPEYQRFFVWSEEKTKTLIRTFENNEFVPPVTIGSFRKDSENKNIIIDGQQRLTSVLLAYLDLFPDKEYYKKIVETFIDENDYPSEDDDSLDNILEWSFAKLVEKGNTKVKIKKSIKNENYKEVDFGIDDDADFWKENYLGFSYLVPEIDEGDVEANSQQRYYSSVFRNINIQGETLLPQESRASLYYLNSKYTSYFEPEFSKGIKVKDAKFDFVRCLALLSQYEKQGGESSIARGYGRKMEQYYEQYIYFVVGESELNLFSPFNEIFPDGKYDSAIASIKSNIDLLGITKKYESIINMDMFLFGLVYVVMFQKKEIDLSKKEEIKVAIEEEMACFKAAGDYHFRNPGALKYLRMRIKKSVEVYGRYTK